MTNATIHGHSHEEEPAHDHGGVVSKAALRPVRAGFSLIEASAGGRLIPALLVLAALWAGVYWALH